MTCHCKRSLRSNLIVERERTLRLPLRLRASHSAQRESYPLIIHIAKSAEFVDAVGGVNLADGAGESADDE